jgi:CheY-like chemotaxis protein
VAEDGERGVQLVLDRKPDIALIDIGLPGLDGYHVARELRDRQPGRETRLIALTGYGQPDDRKKALEAGFDAHLVKPVDLERLSKVLAEQTT